MRVLANKVLNIHTNYFEKNVTKKYKREFHLKVLFTRSNGFNNFSKNANALSEKCNYTRIIQIYKFCQPRLSEKMQVVCVFGAGT